MLYYNILLTGWWIFSHLLFWIGTTDYLLYAGKAQILTFINNILGLDKIQTNHLFPTVLGDYTFPACRQNCKTSIIIGKILCVFQIMKWFLPVVGRLLVCQTYVAPSTTPEPYKREDWKHTLFPISTSYWTPIFRKKVSAVFHLCRFISTCSADLLKISRGLFVTIEIPTDRERSWLLILGGGIGQHDTLLLWIMLVYDSSKRTIQRDMLLVIDWMWNPPKYVGFLTPNIAECDLI